MISIATFVIFLLITPGFCFFLGMRLESKHDIALDAENNTTQIVGLITITAVIQIIMLSFWIFALENAFNIPAAKLLTADYRAFFFEDLHFNWQNWGALVVYIASLYAMSFYAGKKLIGYIESGCLQSSSLHGPFYPLLVKGAKRPLINCSLLTKVQNEELQLMYFGTLEWVSYGSKREIKYIVLSDVRKSALQLGEASFFAEKKIATLKNKSDVSFEPSKKNELFYINGEEIANILFSAYPAYQEDLEEANSLIRAAMEAANNT